MDEYEVVKLFYGNTRAKRSGVLYMNHIDEGLTILDRFNCSYESYGGYCLHPLVQEDKIIVNTYKSLNQVNPQSIILAMEYRRVANSYLSRHVFHQVDFGPLPAVKEMLLADKIQNKKDFELYHKSTHPRSRELTEYFDNWMKLLSITESEYKYAIRDL